MLPLMKSASKSSMSLSSMLLEFTKQKSSILFKVFSLRNYKGNNKSLIKTKMKFS